MAFSDESNRTLKTWVREEAAAQHLDVSLSFLRNDRVNGLRGIPYAKCGRAVRYSLEDLDAWMQAQVVTPGEHER